jgi:hypothetical protein
LERSRRARWKHGRYAAEKIKSRRETRALIQRARELSAEIWYNRRDAAGTGEN